MNKFRSKVGLMVVVLCILISSNIFAKEVNNDIYISEDSEEFLISHDIDLEKLKNKLKDYENNVDTFYKIDSNKKNYIGTFDQDIQSLKNADKVYKFSNEKINQYVEGLLKTQAKLDTTYKLRSVDRPKNDDGVGYEVQSKAEFMQATSYATLPSRNINNLSDIVYLFYSIAPNTSDNPVFDFGVRGGMYHWAGQLNPNPNTGEDENIGKNDGDKIYFNINVDKDNWVRCRVVSASDFSDVLYDKYYYLGGINKNNASFNKQITLCNPNRNFETGSSVYNGGFSQSYLYRSNGSYTPMNSNVVTSRTGKFGVQGISGSRDKVIINSNSQWDEEDISIKFN